MPTVLDGFPLAFGSVERCWDEPLGNSDMESVAYILILTLAIGVLFFAIAFREPPRIGK